jgi:DNA-binding MarR family transcriptional regulator
MQFGKLITQLTQESYEERIASVLQFSALNYLKSQPNLGVSDLAGHLRLSKSSATQLVERLVKAGFVLRRHDPVDRRVVRLLLTRAGEKEILVLKKNILEKLNKVFSKVPKGDIEKLIRIYSGLIKRLRKDVHE